MTQEKKKKCKKIPKYFISPYLVEFDEELTSGVAWKEEHQKLLDYKFALLNKLGNTYSLSEIKTYNLY